MTPTARRIGLCAIAVVIVAVTMWPPSTFVGHSHWDQVEWIPFRSTWCTVSDAISRGLWWLNMTGVLRWPCQAASSRADISIGGFDGPQQ